MGVVPGNAHIKCGKFAKPEQLKQAVVLLMTPRVQDYVDEVKEQYGVELSEHGVNRGWCFWPLLFDPIWVDECPHFDGVCPEHKPETKNKGGK